MSCEVAKSRISALLDHDKMFIPVSGKVFWQCVGKCSLFLSHSRKSYA